MPKGSHQRQTEGLKDRIERNLKWDLCATRRTRSNSAFLGQNTSVALKITSLEATLSGASGAWCYRIRCKDWLVQCQYIVTRWDCKFDMQLLSQSVSMCSCQSRSNSCSTDIKQARKFLAELLLCVMSLNCIIFKSCIAPSSNKPCKHPCLSQSWHNKKIEKKNNNNNRETKNK